MQVKPLKLAKSALVRLAGPVGLYAAANWITLRSPRILMYHRFGPVDQPGKVGVDTLRTQLRLLKRRFVMLDLEVEAAALEPSCSFSSRLPSSRPSVAVTIDDGYSDFWRYAYPVFADERIHPVFFVTTGFLDRQCWLWPDAVEYGLLNSEVTRLSGGWGKNGPALELGTAASRQNAWRSLIDLVIDMDDSSRGRLIGNLMDALQVELPAVPVEGYDACTWRQIREMASDGIRIGAHTVDHSRLARLNDHDLSFQLQHSRRRVSEEVGTAPMLFCYPNGMPADYDDRCLEAVKQAGYRLAFTAFADGSVGGDYDMRRLGVNSDWFQFKKSVFGVEHLGRLFNAHSWK